MERFKRYTINREFIGFFKAILESYEEVGIFSVLDGKEGLIEVIYPSNFEQEIKGIIMDMANYGAVMKEVEDV
jgi:hypothetical protein